jgi:hypothetical protein
MLLELVSAHVQRFGMTTPQIHAVIEDGPRAGETIVLDADATDSPPHEIMLPDGHMGSRTHGGAVDRPTHSVSRYRLIGPAEGDNFRYQVVPHDQ